MATLDSLFLAESFAIDQATNRLSLFNITENLTFADVSGGGSSGKVGLLLSKLYAISIWRFDEEELGDKIVIRLRITGNEERSATTEILVRGHTHRVIQGIVLTPPKAGQDIPKEFLFELFLGDESDRRGEYRIKVNVPEGSGSSTESETKDKEE